MNLAVASYVDAAMAKSGARAKAHGWGVSLRYLGRTLVDRSARDDQAITLGEHPGCSFVVPGLAESTPLTAGGSLLLPPGLEGVVQVAGEERPIEALRAAGGVALAPGDRALLRVTAHPEIELEVRRVERERLPLRTRISLRDLTQQLVTGAALFGSLALLWQVERPVNTIKLKGDPEALEDSALLRAMFLAPVEEPPEVLRARALYARPLLAPPPPSSSTPTPDELVAAAPAPIPMTWGGAATPEPIGGVVLPAEQPQKRRSKRERRGGRPRANDVEMFAMMGVLNASDDGALHALVGSEIVDADLDVLAGVGAPGGVVGGVIGDAPTVAEDMPVETASDEVLVEHIMGPGAAEPDELAIGSRISPPAGVASHAAEGAERTRGERDGTAAAVFEAQCDDPTIVPKRQVDVVFAIDVSTTMTFMLDKIEREIAAVDAAARGQGLDPRYGLVVFVDDVELANGGQPYVDIAELQRELAVWQAFTASNRQVRTRVANLDWPENSLDALHAAATKFQWRPAATTLRVVVHATDDDFGEAPAVQSGQAVQHTYAETLTALRAAEVRVHSFAAKIGGQCECLDVRAGIFTAYRGQKAIPEATGGAVFDIDEVAAGKLGFAAAMSGALQSAVCTHYPLSPFGAAKP